MYKRITREKKERPTDKQTDRQSQRTHTDTQTHSRQAVNQRVDSFTAIRNEASNFSVCFSVKTFSSTN